MELNPQQTIKYKYSEDEFSYMLLCLYAQIKHEAGINPDNIYSDVVDKFNLEK